MRVAIIPARGGSKRIPKKNIKNFLGKPIISYSIDAAKKSNLFEKIIVSTDDHEISNIAIKYGAEVPFFRPKEIADDHSGIHSVIKHAIEWLEDSGNKIDYACCIYATAPTIRAADIIHGYEIIKSGKWESVIAATNFPYPIYRSFKELPNSGLEMIFPEHYSTRSQDLPETYHDAGQFYWALPDFIKGKPKRFSQKNSIVKLPYYMVQDIDSNEDWKRAEILYEMLNKTD